MPISNKETKLRKMIIKSIFYSPWKTACPQIDFRIKGDVHFVKRGGYANWIVAGRL